MNISKINYEEYDFVGALLEDAAWVMLDGKMWHIDKTGKPLYKEKYDCVTHFIDGVACVRFGNEDFFINKHGKRI